MSFSLFTLSATRGAAAPRFFSPKVPGSSTHNVIGSVYWALQSSLFYVKLRGEARVVAAS